MESENQNTAKSRNLAEILKDSFLIIVTLFFVLLYAAAFTGKFDPLKDNTLLLRLEPIIFILIGFSFGRLPARQNEKSLKQEIERQIQKADASQYAKEKAQLECESLEEKIRNARLALKQIVSAPANGSSKPDIAALKSVVGILDS